MYLNRLLATTVFSLFLTFFCFSQEIYLTSQAQVDAFDPSTTVISGDLNINGSNNSNPITNLNNLSNLTTIGGYLLIRDNTPLPNLNGLSNLMSIGEWMDISDNAALINLNGLSNPISTGESMRIFNNASLTNLDGLSGLTSIGESLAIQYNSALTNCCGIQDLLNISEAISGNIAIHSDSSGCDSENEIIDAYCGLMRGVLVASACLYSNNDSIEISIDDSESPPFNYEWEESENGMSGNGMSTDDTFTIENLLAGTYNITVISPFPDTTIPSGGKCREKGVIQEQESIGMGSMVRRMTGIGECRMCRTMGSGFIIRVLGSS
jgi:hypothetical protein